MKTRYLIPIVFFFGLAVLFFFPEPESNFIWYSLIALVFITIIVFLVIKERKKLLLQE